MGTIYRNNILYGGQAPASIQFIGTKAEWTVLSEEEKNKYINHEVIFKDEDNKSVNIYTVDGELINVGGDGDAVVEVEELPTDVENKVYVTKEAEPTPLSYPDNNELWIAGNTYTPKDAETGEPAYYIQVNTVAGAADFTYEDASGFSMDIHPLGDKSAFTNYGGDYCYNMNAKGQIVDYPAIKIIFNGTTYSSTHIYAKEPIRFKMTSTSHKTGITNSNHQGAINPEQTIVIPEYFGWVCIRSKATTHDLSKNFTASSGQYTYIAETRSLTASEGAVNEVLYYNQPDDYDFAPIKDPEEPKFTTQVFAKDVELATKEYVDKHGGGADNQLILNDINEWYALSFEEREKYLNCEIIIIHAGIYVYKIDEYGGYVLEPIATSNDFPNGLYASQIAAYKGEDDDFVRSHIYLTDQVEIHTGQNREDENESTLAVQGDKIEFYVTDNGSPQWDSKLTFDTGGIEFMTNHNGGSYKSGMFRVDGPDIIFSTSSESSDDSIKLESREIHLNGYKKSMVYVNDDPVATQSDLEGLKAITHVGTVDDGTPGCIWVE